MSARDWPPWAITKKAIVERLRGRYRTDWFAEDAETVSIDAWRCTATSRQPRSRFDASGTALNRRGYRTRRNGEAPLRETPSSAALRPRSAHGDPACPCTIRCAARHADDRSRHAHGAPRAGADPRICPRIVAQHAGGSVPRHPRTGARGI
ncbi:MAG: hypothetical protein ACLUHE_07445 [Christensenellales bacterium]